ncbi:MAG: HAMP domain-containing sensor histidine kinase [bacterium]
MRFHRIQHRIILLFVLFATVVLLLSGWTLQWSLRQSLEAELGHKLTAVASAVAVQYGEEEVAYLQRGLGPRATERMRETLLRMKTEAELKRIYLFDLDGRSLLDTDVVPAGEPYHQLRFYQQEMDAIGAGSAASTILFQDREDQPAMTGFAPLLAGGDAVGGVGVEGGVTFLDAIGELRTRLYVIGLFGVLAAILLGWLLARTITRPVHALVNASRKIASGDYRAPIVTRTSDEIGALATTMEEMREGVLARERELKAMLAGVAHEIRNPLGGIELFVGLLGDDVAGNAEAEQRVARIGREVGQLKNLVESFLEYARPKTPTVESCGLGNIIGECISLVEDQLMAHGIKVIVDLPSPAPVVLADPQHLKQILLNLLRNAIQAQPEGGDITFTSSRSGTTCTVTVTDAGDGIPPEAQERIFEPFFTTRQSGTGLGLAMVKSLVETNGGSIRLVRTGKDGTVFDVTLPAATASFPGRLS